MTCDPEEVHVWRIDLDAAPATRAKLQATLTPGEMERAERFRTPQLQNRSIVARGAVRRILGRYTQTDPGELRFRTGMYGKPELESPQAKIFFNLSHSRNLALFAVATCGRVGVDAEYVQNEIVIEEVSCAFSRTESDGIMALPRGERLAAFYSTWVRKEAFTKALGYGLSLPLD